MKIEDKHLDQRLSTNLKTFTKGENPLNRNTNVEHMMQPMQIMSF